MGSRSSIPTAKRTTSAGGTSCRQDVSSRTCPPRHEINTVVLVDDFIGSDGTAIKALASIAKDAHALRDRPPINWFLFAVTGLPEGVTAVAECEAAVQLGLRVEMAHPISEANLPFSSKSSVFPEPDEREQARKVVAEYGERIGNPWPLGYGGQAALVVFSENCPNNAPAILWSDSADWLPLFARTGH